MRAVAATALSVMLLSTAVPSAEAAPTCGASLKYYGGPILQNVKIYGVMWSANVTTGVATTMPAFYQAIVQSPYLDWLSEYDTVGVNGQDGQPGSNQGISRGTYGGTFTLTPSVCAGTTACTVTDAQIQQELTSQIAAGHLPAPTVGCDGQNDTIYLIHFPANVTETTADGSKSCQVFCYYQGGATIGGKTLLYAVLPDVTSGACAGGCGNATQPIDNQTAWGGYALLDAITDPEIGLATGSGVGRPLGWYADACGGIADVCLGQQATITTGTMTWTVALGWSRAASACVVSRTTLPPICAGPGTPTGCRACTCADDHQGAVGQVGCAGATAVCDTGTQMCVAGAPDGGAGAGGHGGAGGAGAGGNSGGAGGGGAAGGNSGAAGGGGAAGGASGSGAAGATGHATGTEGGACYGNGTCNAGLICLSQLCVMPPDAGTSSGKSGGGCGCAVAPTARGLAALPLLILILLAGRRRPLTRWPIRANRDRR